MTGLENSRALDDWSLTLAETLDRSARTRDNETELREDADRIMASALSELFGMDPFGTTAERSPRRGTRRRYDKLYGGVVVEWEWGGEERRRGGAGQALDYLADVRAEIGTADAFTAVVCDGVKWGFLAIDPGDAPPSLFDANRSPAGHFEWHDNSASACRRFLELVGSHQKSPLTARRLAQSFGPESDAAKVVVARLSEALAGRSNDDRIDTLYREWRRSLDVAYGDLDAVVGELAEMLKEAYDLRVDRSVGEYLFAVHTYFALVARLLAVEVLAISTQEIENQPTHWEALDDAPLQKRLSDLEDGSIPAGLEIQNLFEGDVFSWYLDAAAGNVDLLNGIRTILATMSTMAFPRIAYGIAPAMDILRDLYQTLVPRMLRRRLGEFLTPTWLAEACLDRLKLVGANVESGRVLDPTCGTGTFLLPILRRRVAQLRTQPEQDRSTQVRLLLQSLGGFDINPVAVIAARVNFLLALGDLAAAGPIALPVWRCDSVLVPDASPREGEFSGRLTGRPWQRLATSLPFPFPIPPALATADRMARLRRMLEEASHAATDEQGVEEFKTDLELAFGPSGDDRVADSDAAWEDVVEVAVELYSRLRVLVNERRNGVWARIIENSFAPLSVGKFDVVVGNPPWLTWTRLPERWRSAAEPIWRTYGLWLVPAERGERRAAQLASTDMAVIVFARSADLYLADGGTIGLLTPDSLATGDPGGRAFRRFRLREDVDTPAIDLPLRVTHLDNWSDIAPFAPDASNRPIFITAIKGQPTAYPVPTTRWRRAVPGAKLVDDWSSTRLALTAQEGISRPVDPDAPTSAWSFQAEDAPPLIRGGTNKWHFGKGLDTRGANGIFFVRILQARRAEGRVLVENGLSGRNPDVEVTRGWVDSDLVHPLLRGRDVHPWVAAPSCYIVCPYPAGNVTEILGEKEFRQTYKATWNWLRRHRPHLIERRTPPTRNWDITGDDWARLDGPMNHMGGEHLVVVREQAERPAAAIVSAHFDDFLGRTAAPLVDHKLSFCSVESQDEALYLCAFLNSTPIQDLLASFSNTTAVAPQTLARLPIPTFDPENGLHSELVSAANFVMESHAVAEAIANAQGPIDGLVSELVMGPEALYQAQPARPRRDVRRRRQAPRAEIIRLFDDPESLESHTES